MGSLMVIYHLVTNKETELLTIKGEVIVASDDYVIIEGINEDYVINNIKGKYKIGDIVEFKYLETDIDTKASPKTIKIKDEELIKVKDNGLDTDKNDEEDKSQDTNNDFTSNSDNNSNVDNNTEDTEPNTGISNNNEENNSSTTDNNFTSSSNEAQNKETDVDTEVLNYFNDYQAKIDSNNLGSSVKSGFVSIIDFLFYNGTIKGHTFSELTAGAKLKVLAMALYFDGKIEKYFPGYKESISSTTSKIYTNIKEKVVSTYLNIASSVCASNSEACESARSGFAELKKNFSLTWDLIKDIAGDGLSNLKNWYEIWRTT